MNNKTALTTLALASAVRKPLPPPSRPFKSKKREARNAWRKQAD